MGTSVHAVFRTERVPLSSSASASAPVTIPAEYLTIELESEDALPSQVILDKRPVSLALTANRKRGQFMLDAFRSVGFHCLQTGSESFYFATEDAKLKIEGILRLLHYVGSAGLSWGQQIFFADGTALRDVRVDYAWLLEAGPRIIAAAREISTLPFQRYRTSIEEGLPTGGRVLVPRTLALIRRDGFSSVECDPRGCLSFHGLSYTPRRAVVARRRMSNDTVANRRVARLLIEALALGAQVLDGDIPIDAKRALAPIVDGLNQCLQLYPFARLLDDRALTEMPSPEETIDERYALTFELYETLRKELGWRAGLQRSNEYAFVAYSDQIYQAFVASLLASGLGAQCVGATLMSGLSVPSFRSERYEIYYDTTPPEPEFRNWRNLSSRPSEMRPDLTVVDREEYTGLLLDAKYRVSGSGRAPAEALSECQVYMHSFQHNVIGLCYPGHSARMDRIRADRFEILEISLGPYEGVDTFVQQTVIPALKEVMQPVAVAL